MGKHIYSPLTAKAVLQAAPSSVVTALFTPRKEMNAQSSQAGSVIKKKKKKKQINLGLIRAGVNQNHPHRLGTNPECFGVRMHLCRPINRVTPPPR